MAPDRLRRPWSRGPSDPCGCVYLGFVLCGAGFLLPYNCFISAVDFYQARFPGSTIIFDMSLTYIVVALVGVTVSNVLVESVPLTARITAGYVLAFTTLLLVLLLDVHYAVFPPTLSRLVTLAALALVSLGCTVQQSSFYGYTSMLPARYTQAVMTGESAAGLVVSINRVLTKAMLHDVTANTTIFFSVCTGSVALCCLVFTLTRRSHLVTHHVDTCRRAGTDDDQRGIVQPHNMEEVDILEGSAGRDHYGVLVLDSPGASQHPPPQPPALQRPPTPDEPRPTPATRHLSLWDRVKSGCVARYHIAGSVWPYMLSIGAAYLVTLCLFPGVESEIISCRLGSWMPVILIATFNLMDFIGKIVASVPYRWSGRHLVLCSISRVLLVPLMMLCATPRHRPVIAGEAPPVLLSAALGLTNGYFGSVPMILAPSKVPDHHKELTGNLMTVSYSVGLTVGSVVAYTLDAALGPHPLHDVICPPHNLTTTPNPYVTQPS